MPKGFRVTFEIDKLDPILPLIQGEVRGLKVEQIEEEPERNEVLVRGVPINQAVHSAPKTEFPNYMMKSAPKVLNAVRELQNNDARGAWYKDVGKYIMEHGGAPGVGKPESVGPIISALWRAGRVIRTQRGYYRLAH